MSVRPLFPPPIVTDWSETDALECVEGAMSEFMASGSGVECFYGVASVRDGVVVLETNGGTFRVTVERTK